MPGCSGTASPPLCVLSFDIARAGGPIMSEPRNAQQADYRRLALETSAVAALTESADERLLHYQIASAYERLAAHLERRVKSKDQRVMGSPDAISAGRQSHTRSS